ncbi:hypothetical protein ABIC33_006759 [Variovorax sp. 1140]|uniref:hypothetical protein n=1 Tax=Variovorax atrisoli TaxID=3394203 RepID=UPI0033925B24
MKNDSVNLSIVRSAASQQLHCNVVVEPSSIDFLNEGSMFAAGSNNDCGCFISPMPEPKKGHRRNQSSGER